MRLLNATIGRSSIVLILMLFSVLLVRAQTISQPRVNNGCATTDPAQNNFSVSASVSGFTSTANFSLILSNKSGSFLSDTLRLSQASLNSGGTEVTFNFSYPENDGSGTALGSDLYRVRVIEEGTNSRSRLDSDVFSAYIFNNITPTLEPRVLCSLSALRAETDFPRYLWFREVVGAIDEMVQDGPEKSYVPIIPGRYYYVPFYGNCQLDLSVFNTRSNTAIVDDEVSTIQVNIVSNVVPASICVSDVLTLSISNPTIASNPDFRFTWLKDGEVILGQSGASLLVSGADEGGIYRVEVTDTSAGFSECRTSSSNPINVIVSPSIKITSPLFEPDLPGMNPVLTVSVIGDNPIITWLKDGVVIPNSNTTSFTSIGPGKYKARVTTTGVCANTVETSNEIEIAPVSDLIVIIDSLTPNSDVCAASEVQLVVSDITTIINSTIVTLPTNTFGSLNIRWFKDINDGNGSVDTGITGTTITINNFLDNGMYQARVSADAVYFSNPLNVKVNLSSLTILGADQSLNIGETITLEVALPDGICPTNDFSFKWFRNNIVEKEGVGCENSVLEVDSRGSYKVEVNMVGCPSQTLETVQVSSVPAKIPNVLVLGSENNWDLPLEFTNTPSIGVTIYNANGKIDFETPSNYNGNWPQDSGSGAKGTIYYYIITENNNPLKKGTITIIR